MARADEELERRESEYGDRLAAAREDSEDFELDRAAATMRRLSRERMAG